MMIRYNSAATSIASSSLLLTTLLCWSSIIDNVISSSAIPATNRPNWYENFDRSEHFGGTLYTLDDFKPYYDENGKLWTHLLLYPVSCSSIMNDNLIDPLLNSEDLHNRFHGRKVHTVAGDAEKEFFGTMNGGYTLNCNAVCIERGMDETLIQHPMPHLYYKSNQNKDGTPLSNNDGKTTNNDESKSLSEWYRSSCEGVEFGFINYYANRELNVMWVDGNGNKHFNRKLDYGDTKQEFVPSYIGHILQVEDPITNEVLLTHLVEFGGMRSVGWYNIPNEAKNKGGETLDAAVKETLDFEWEKHNKVKRTFSTNGFAKGKLPNDVFGQISAYYYNNQNAIYMEEWNSGDKGLFVNWWEYDVHFMNVPFQLKQIWQQRLLTMVEQWTNTKLEQTSMYGIRQYETGARLLTHVDRINTHAASMIINVAQGNLIEPWRVEVYDHADRLHEVIMEPGDVVYYESAKALHGRNTPLKGGYYANIFTHYRPIGDPQWYEKDNPVGTPEPLLDIGNCYLVGPTNIYSQGSVECDDKRIGRHLSPTLFQATNANDLFHWWKNVAASPTEKNNKDDIITDNGTVAATEAA